jgi:hypothetical protein
MCASLDGARADSDRLLLAALCEHVESIGKLVRAPAEGAALSAADDVQVRARVRLAHACARPLPPSLPPSLPSSLRCVCGGRARTAVLCAPTAPLRDAAAPCAR